MRKIHVIGTAAAASALASGAVVLAVGGGAAASPASHTVHLTAVTLRSFHTNKRFVQTEKDVKSGKTVGYDSVSCTFNLHNGTAVCDAALAQTKGLTYVHVTVDQQGSGSGKITGGTGAFKGASGTITLARGSSSKKTKITLVYSG